MIHWIVEPEVFQNDTRLIAALREMGLPHTVVKLGKSYDEYVCDALQAIEPTDRITVHGSYQLVRTCRNESFIRPFGNSPKFEVRYVYPRFGSLILNRNYVLVPFGDLIARREFLFDCLGVSGRVFVKSNDFKDFPGMVMSRSSWERDLANLTRRVDPECLAMVCPPTEISREWRTVVVDGKVISGSLYKPTLEPATDDILKYAQAVVNKVNYKPDGAWTLDICLSNGDLKVLETGPFSCCGLYHCDLPAVITAVGAIVR